MVWKFSTIGRTAGSVEHHAASPWHRQTFKCFFSRRFPVFFFICCWMLLESHKIDGCLCFAKKKIYCYLNTHYLSFIFSNAAGHRWKIWTWRAGEGERADGIESPKGSVVLKFWRSKRCRKWIYNTVTSNDLMLGDGAPKKKYVIQLRTGLNMIAHHWNVRCGEQSAHEMSSWTTRNGGRYQMFIRNLCPTLMKFYKCSGRPCHGGHDGSFWTFQIMVRTDVTTSWKAIEKWGQPFSIVMDNKIN